MTENLLKTNVIVKHLAGSKSYGTNTPESDTDYRGIFFADRKSINTPWFKIEQITDPTEEDTVFFELSKFMKLAVDQNPNVIETLWVPNDCVVKSTPVYELLRSHRHALLSSRAALTYSGYGLSQLKRIKGHNKWINNPEPQDAPKQRDYLFLVHNNTPDKILKFNIDEFESDHRLISVGNNVFMVIDDKGTNLCNDDGSLNYSRVDGSEKKYKLLVRFDKDGYKVSKEKHRQYWDWVSNRNAKRSVFESSFGYDTKHAMHLIRLIRTAQEILTDEHILVRRPDASELLEIRNGKWSYDELLKYAEDMNVNIRTVLLKNTNLPTNVDLNFASNLLLDCYDQLWSK